MYRIRTKSNFALFQMASCRRPGALYLSALNSFPADMESGRASIECTQVKGTRWEVFTAAPYGPPYPPEAHLGLQRLGLERSSVSPLLTLLFLILWEDMSLLQ